MCDAKGHDKASVSWSENVLEVLNKTLNETLPVATQPGKKTKHGHMTILLHLKIVIPIFGGRLAASLYLLLACQASTL